MNSNHFSVIMHLPTTYSNVNELCRKGTLPIPSSPFPSLSLSSTVHDQYIFNHRRTNLGERGLECGLELRIGGSKGIAFPGRLFVCGDSGGKHAR